MAKLNWRYGKFFIFGVTFGLFIITLLRRPELNFSTSGQIKLLNIRPTDQKKELFKITDQKRINQEKSTLTSTTRKPLIVSPDPIPLKDLGHILAYHAQEKRWCLEKIANRSNINWCPCIPPDLKGRVLVNMADDLNWGEISESVGMDVRSGGEWMPENCVAHTRLAIIIPCRDRERHLRILLRHLYPILKRQLTHFRIFVVDQRFPNIFNKAAIMNIGFLEAEKRFPFDCVMFHDVDMLLEDDRALMRCGPNPRHYAKAVDKFSYKLYPTFGGVVSLTKEMFRKVNGYSLRFFGWGGEDDDMWSRVKKFWDVYGPLHLVSRYSTIFHTEDATNKRNPKRHRLIDSELRRYKNGSFDGVSDVLYNLNAVELRPLYTRIEADINTTFLAHPRYETSRYRKLYGVCSDTDLIINIGEVSWSSCRFQCDILSSRPCYGFSISSGQCQLTIGLCELSQIANSISYIKESMFIHSNSTAKPFRRY